MTVRNPNPAKVAAFVKSLTEELVVVHRMPRGVVRHLRAGCMVELVDAFRHHRASELRQLMAAPRLERHDDNDDWFRSAA